MDDPVTTSAISELATLENELRERRRDSDAWSVTFLYEALATVTKRVREQAEADLRKSMSR